MSFSRLVQPLKAFDKLILPVDQIAFSTIISFNAVLSSNQFERSE